MRKKIAALAVALLAALSVTVAVAPSAHAASVMWQVHYGTGYTSNPPNVYSNRVPIWDTGGDPHLRAERDGNFRDLGSWCNGGVCWQTNTSGAGCLPVHWVWQGDGNFVGYDCAGHVVYATNTYYNYIANFVIMTLWSDACLTIHFYNDSGNYWQLWWVNSSNPACQHSL